MTAKRPPNALSLRPSNLTGLDTEALAVVQSPKMMVAITNLRDGVRFRMPLEQMVNGTLQQTGWVYGTKLYSNLSRCRVRIDGEQKQVTFTDGGKTRTFHSSGATEMNYPTSIEVEQVSEQDALEAEFGRSERRQSMDNGQAVAIQARYDHQQKQLAAAIEAENEGKISTAKQRIAAIEAEAETAGVTLHALNTAATAPTGSTGKEADTMTTKGKGKTTTKAVPAKTKGQQLKEANAARKASLAAKAPAKKAPAPAKKAKKLDSTRDCLCGCKQETNGLFRPGHDARVKGLLLKVERGEMAYDELPATLRDSGTVKFAGKSATAGKDGSDYRIVKSPVKFPAGSGHDSVEVVKPE